ncbi:MAG TPA: NADH-quinone oxidoreductase subunit L [Vicinamibacteria bacterium]|nr:NADH-quinone oxidoreductase subunit L [Vicinamibacteria bacterium]
MKFVFLVPLFPLLGFLFNFVFGVRALRRATDEGRGHGHHEHGVHVPPPRFIGVVAAGAVLLSFVVALAAVVAAHGRPDHTLVETLWTWIPGGAVEAAGGPVPFTIEWAYQVDPLSSVMILVVTFVGFFIHVYSVGYMGHDPGYARYMAYLNLFMFAMLTLVLGANYAVLFVGWEGVGLCSYLLIGFWFDRQSASNAGMKAFIVNRIGDAGFLLGVFLIFTTFGTLDFRAVAAAAALMPVEWAWGGTLTVIALCLFWGAAGKSAQLPLFVWLPDAMEGPTPVSALIHAATMVTAGVYMVARSSAIFAHAPRAMFVVALVGALTAVFAALIGLVQNDIKRVLAYSTVSQLGYMFLACGVGAFAAGVFHLMTHAFFKALLFLGSGSVIHAMSGEQDMRRMGGLKAKLPWTHRTMLVGCIAIAGVPPLAGFFSKDEILWSAYRIGGYGTYVWAMGFAVAALTAFYMFRLYHLTFSGTFRGTEEQAHHVHESPRTMIVPLQVLAVGSILAGLLGVPAVLGHPLHVPNVFEHFTEPVFAAAHQTLRAEVFTRAVPGHGIEIALMLASITVAALGIALAWALFRRHPELPDRIAGSVAPVYRVLLGKFYVDELYDRVFVRGLALGGGRSLYALDRHVIDGGDGEVRPGLGVNGLAWFVRDVLARVSNLWDRYVVDGLVNLTAMVLDNLSYVLRSLQNGLVQHYALSMLIIVLFMIGIGSRFIL